MASPAAVLEIVVDANTTAATASLSKFDRTLKGTGTTAGQTSRYHDSLNKSTSRVGSAMKSAALAAGSAAVAYLSISQAKTAITTTQDLAKTTAGLHRNLALSTKRASEWGAVAKARDIDTKSLNMSFTTLSRRITDLSKGSTEAKDSFADIGVTQKDLAKTNGDFNKQLLLVADAFGQAEGGAQRQQAAQKLLGRGYQTLLPLMAEGSASLEEQLGWADKYGAAMSGKTLKAQMDVVNAQRESKVAMLGLQVAFTQALTPALQKANEEFQKIANIMGSDKLTQAEKFKRVGQIIGKWADKAFDAFVGILPKMIEKAGEKAPAIAGALVKGFMNADIWGKLLTGAWIFSKLGGAAAFSKKGSLAGKVFGKAFVLGVLFALPSMLKDAEQFGEMLGHKILDGIQKIHIDDMLLHFLGLQRTLTKGEVIEGVKQGGREGGLSIDQALDSLKEVGVATKKAAKIVNEAYGFAADGAEKGNKRIADSTGDMSQKSSKSHRNLASNATEASRRAASNVVGSTNNMVSKVGEGYNKLKDDTNKALAAFHVKKLSYSINQRSDRPGGTTGAGGHHTFQRGGPIPGMGSGDKIPAMLEPGEYVLNRNAVGALGKEKLDKINFGVAKRFAKGGSVTGDTGGLKPEFMSALQGMSGGTGRSISVNSGYRSRAEQAALYAAYLNGTGNLAAPPGSSHHELGIAADIAPGRETFGSTAGTYGLGFTVPSESWHIELVKAGLAASGMPATAANIKRVILQGPKGPWRSMGQGGLDKVWKTARAKIAEASAAAQPTVGGALGPSVATGPIQQMAQAMVSKMWGPGEWSAFNSLEMAEAGWNPKAVNASSGAAGLAQALPPSKYPPGAWPYTGLDSAKLQLQWMMGYIKDTYGSPSSAYSTWLSRSPHWYQKGGEVQPFVGSYKDGGRVPRDGMAQVHKGETITPAQKKEWDKLIHTELKEIHQEMREERRLRRQTRGVLREQGSRWIVDAIGSEIADTGVRAARNAGTGRLTHIGGKRSG